MEGEREGKGGKGEKERKTFNEVMGEGGGRGDSRRKKGMGGRGGKGD